MSLPHEIRTARLVLRPWTENDVGDLGRAITDSIEHLRPWMPWIADEPLTGAQRLELIDTWRTDREHGGDVVLGVFAAHTATRTATRTATATGEATPADGKPLRTGAVVGGCGLHRRSGPGVLDIGYWIHVDHTRRGYATELSRALADAAFGLDEIESVEIHHDKANVASSGVPRRLGFEFVGERPDRVTSPGEIGIDCTWRARRHPTVR